MYIGIPVDFFLRGSDGTMFQEYIIKVSSLTQGRQLLNFLEIPYEEYLFIRMNCYTISDNFVSDMKDEETIRENGKLNVWESGKFKKSCKCNKEFVEFMKNSKAKDSKTLLTKHDVLKSSLESTLSEIGI